MPKPIKPAEEKPLPQSTFQVEEYQDSLWRSRMLLDLRLELRGYKPQELIAKLQHYTKILQDNYPTEAEEENEQETELPAVEVYDFETDDQD